jgi:hypothetical protein
LSTPAFGYQAAAPCFSTPPAAISSGVFRSGYVGNANDERIDCIRFCGELVSTERAVRAAQLIAVEGE